MAEKARPGNNKGESRRLNRAVGAAEALGRTLDPVFKKRGFASRDIVANWAAMAPQPYDRVARPDRLHWPRGARGTEGATLVLRCAEGHQLALAHEGNRIAAAVNRYFGYVLVGTVRLSAEPFSANASDTAPAAPEPPPEVRARIGALVGDVADDGLRAALTKLGEALAVRKDD